MRLLNVLNGGAPNGPYYRSGGQKPPNTPVSGNPSTEIPASEF